MKKVHNTRVIRPIRKGELITAQYLTRISAAINANTRFLSGPKQQNALDETEDANTNSGDFNFTETNRTSSAVTVTDSNGDTHSIEQIDSVTLTNSSGQTLTLTFNNPQ